PSPESGPGGRSGPPVPGRRTGTGEQRSALHRPDGPPTAVLRGRGGVRGGVSPSLSPPGRRADSARRSFGGGPSYRAAGGPGEGRAGGRAAPDAAGGRRGRRAPRSRAPAAPAPRAARPAARRRRPPAPGAAPPPPRAPGPVAARPGVGAVPPRVARAGFRGT